MKHPVRTVLILAIPLQWLSLKALSFFPDIVENYYAQGIYTYLSKGLRFSFGALHFSLGQLLFYVGFLYVIIQLIRFSRAIKKNRNQRKKIFTNGLLNAISYFSIIYLLFNTLWAVNYHREPLQQTFNLALEEPNANALKELCETLIERTNKSRTLVINSANNWQDYSLTNDSLFRHAVSSYREASHSYPILKYEVASIKAVALPKIMSYAGIGGIYFPFTGEANVNTDPPLFKLPFTTCHEMAHQLGFASETDANFVSYLVCSTSTNPLFNYSGNLAAMRYSMSALYRSDSTAYVYLTKQYSPELVSDLDINKAYWKQFESPFEDISHSINDVFLKANGQSEGIRSYGKMVDLLLAHFKQQQRP